METKTESTHQISHAYRDEDGNEQKTIVKLKIDFNSKSYSITPFAGHDSFRFVSSSYKYRMWQATLKAIDFAIEFANKELS